MEQGLGDMLQFIRYAELVKQQGATVVVECPAFLHPLLGRCRGIDRLVAEGTPLPHFDAHVPLLSLPHRLHTTLATIPANIPYLFADDDRVQHWGRQLAPLAGFRIGIAWQGNRYHQWDHFRSFPVTQFAPLAQIREVRFISLQKGPGADQLKQRGHRFPVIELDSEQDAASAAFMDTAAIMQHLDLVITADTAIAHLAGGLGVPVWVALSAVNDWRWLRGRDDSPWYPTLRLFRQPRLGDWDGVFERMATEVPKLVGQAGRPKPILVETTPGDLIDRITRLEIECAEVSSAESSISRGAELARLMQARDGALARSPDLTRLSSALRAANQAVAMAQVDMQRYERDEDFGPGFVELACLAHRRSVERAALIDQINTLAHASARRLINPRQ
jgi:hypothetical protein